MLIKLDNLGDPFLYNKTFGGVIGSSGGFHLPTASDLFSPDEYVKSGVPVPTNTTQEPPKIGQYVNTQTDLSKKAETLFNDYDSIIPYVVIGIIIYFLL